MPFVMRERKDGKIDVVNPLNGSVKGTHKNKRQALGQMRALYANVPDALHKRRKQEPTNNQLWMQAKNEAKRRFEVYPSAYANGWAVQWYKARGGGWKTVTDSDVPTEIKDPGTMKKDLRTWFKEDWVDISKPIRKNGKIVDFEACGRSEASSEEGGYPKCLPKAKAMKLTEEERLTLVARKRRAGEPTDGKPIMTSSMTEKTAVDELRKLQRQYTMEEWVDITKPIRDAAGLVVGFQTVDSKKDAVYPFKRKRALKLTDQERKELVAGKLGDVPDTDGVPSAPKKKEVKKYGRYKRQPSKFGI